MPSQTKSSRTSQTNSFISACWDGRLEGIAQALAVGLDINLQHKCPLPFAPNLQDSGLTGLMYATIQGHTNAAKFLLRRGASVSIRSKLRNTALGYAAALGRTQMVETLLSRGADPDDTFTAGFGVFSVLHQACHNGHLGTARALIRHGADVKSLRFGSPLQAAAEAGRLEIVRDLLKAGANPNPPQKKPLITAAARGDEKIAKLLLSAGADVNCTDTWGMTPLMWAARNGHMHIVKLLVVREANVDALSGNLSDGKLTAVGFAQKEKHLDVVAVLKQAGANLSWEPPKTYKVRLRRGGEWIK